MRKWLVQRASPLLLASSRPQSSSAHDANLMQRKKQAPKEAAKSTMLMEETDEPAAAAQTALAPTNDSAAAVASKGGRAPLTPVEQYFLEVEEQENAKRLADNATIPYPLHPDEIVPQFRRIRRHQKQIFVLPDPDYPSFPRKDNFITLPKAEAHPWVPSQPIGPHIVHGDGQMGVVGTGEVGFSNDEDPSFPLPKQWRGLRPSSIVGKALPLVNGNVLDGNTVVKHSFELTGRGVFATKDVKAGDIVMVVSSTAQSIGMLSEQRRLIDMCVELLTSTAAALKQSREEGEERCERFEFLHDWILQGQQSALVERWLLKHTDEVIERIGGKEVLDFLELHPTHIARLAAIMDMNSFVVESSFNERRGMAYWPEAGLFNHSCSPNVTYDILPEHTFRESEFFEDAVETGVLAEEEDGSVVAKNGTIPTQTVASSSGSADTVDEGKADEPAPNSSSPPGVALATTAADSSHNNNKSLYHDVNLTGSGAPTYLFCCRATHDVKAGEELLISYVPTQWTFDARQYVLLDRYRFRCKCPRCAPTLDSKYGRFSKFTLVVAALLLSGQGFLIFLKRKKEQEVTEAENVPVEGQRPSWAEQSIFSRVRQRELHDKNYDMGPERGNLPVRFYNNDPMTRAPE